MNQEVLPRSPRRSSGAKPAALVTIVSTTGSTPQRVGAKMLVFADGRIVGTIGGGCYENDAFWKAREAITRRAGRSWCTTSSTDDFAAGDRADLRRADGRLHRADRAVARARTSSAPATSASTSRGSRTRSASACTSSTTARSSPTASASPTPPRSSSKTSRPGSRARRSRRTRTW